MVSLIYMFFYEILNLHGVPYLLDQISGIRWVPYSHDFLRIIFSCFCTVKHSKVRFFSGVLRAPVGSPIFMIFLKWIFIGSLINSPKSRWIWYGVPYWGGSLFTTRRRLAKGYIIINKNHCRNVRISQEIPRNIRKTGNSEGKFPSKQVICTYSWKEMEILHDFPLIQLLKSANQII